MPTGPSASEPWRKRPRPMVRLYTKGSVAGLDDQEEDPAAILALQADKFAETTWYANKSRQNWWLRRATARGIQPVPLSPQLLHLAAALLRKGGYRSAPLYLAAVKRMHVQAGFPWSDSLRLEYTDSIRATTRGLGPPAQSQPFNLQQVAEIPPEFDAAIAAEGGPAAPTATVLLASWWMLREIELASASVEQLSFIDSDEGCGCARFDLPVSKADQRALGKVRCHTCICPSKLCPVAAARRVHESAVRHSGIAGSAPLLVDRHGKSLQKKDVVSSFQRVAIASGSPASDRITGHSGRVTGAQMLARAGIHEWRISTFGRWGTSTIRRYIRDADVEAASKHLAMDTVQTQIQACAAEVCVKRVTAGKPSAKQKTKAIITERFAQHPEFALAGGAPVLTGAPKKYIIDETSELLGEHSSTSLPHSIMCKQSSRRHIVQCALFSYCGWKWSKPTLRGPSYIIEEREVTDSPRDQWCKKCVRTADRVRVDRAMDH